VPIELVEHALFGRPRLFRLVANQSQNQSQGVSPSNWASSHRSHS
jgi:hypothetical protein